MWLIEGYNQWVGDSQDFCMFVFMVHNCEIDWGFDVFLLGFGIALRFSRL